MKFNVSFTQVNEMSDPGAVREFAQMVDESGFDHLTVSDHVLGANPASRPGKFSPRMKHRKSGIRAIP